MRVAKGQGLLAGCGVTLLLAPIVSAYAADAEDNVGLEEVVVTAQKKAEDLQKASIALDVVSSEQLATPASRMCRPPGHCPCSTVCRC